MAIAEEDGQTAQYDTKPLGRLKAASRFIDRIYVERGIDSLQDNSQNKCSHGCPYFDPLSIQPILIRLHAAAAAHTKGRPVSSLFESQVEQIRTEFPALAREMNGQPVVYFDGAAGTQVHQTVISAITDYLCHRNANHEGLFATSLESDAMLAEVHQAAADFLGADDPDCVSFGPNMTTLTLALSRAMARQWQPSDEIIVTRLDHDANVRPWLLAAEDAGAVVKFVEIHREDCTLDLSSFEQALSKRTRLVAVGLASNAVGTINPLKQMIESAQAHGALTFVDAVHWGPHQLIDVAQLNCDFLACSAYKFFGPHIGMLWGRRGLLESMSAYKLRPASDSLPGKWMTGTQNHECLEGTLAAFHYLADLGRRVIDDDALSAREALKHAYRAIAEYESKLIWQLIDGLKQIPGIKVWGITDPARSAERLPTLALTHNKKTASQLARELASAGIFAWHGNYYALELTESLGLEPEGMLRLGVVHYNTQAEIVRVLEELERICGA